MPARVVAIILAGHLAAYGPAAVPATTPSMARTSAPLAIVEFSVADGLSILGLTVAPDGVVWSCAPVCFAGAPGRPRIRPVTS